MNQRYGHNLVGITLTLDRFKTPPLYRDNTARVTLNRVRQFDLFCFIFLSHT